MKRYLILLFALTAFSAPLWAQQPEVPAAAAMDTSRQDPKVLAMRESERLQKALDLTSKQTKKVYNLYYKHFKSETSQSGGFGRPEGMGGRMGGGPGGPGGPGGMSGGPGRPGGPGMGGGMRGGAPGPGGPEGMASTARPRPADAEELRQKAEKWRSTQAKKFRKIFTDEQYARWEQMIPGPDAPRPGVPTAGKPGSEHPDGPAAGTPQRP